MTTQSSTGLADPRQLAPDELGALEARVARQLADPDGQHVEVLGYGEISCVVACDGAAGRYACKRLPPFPDAASVARYRDVAERYLDALRARGIRVVPSALATTEAASGGPAVYWVQPALPAGSLAPAWLRSCGDRAPGEALLGRVVEAAAAAIDERVGLDAQLSNWALVGDELYYLDVTTPLLRDTAGQMELDAGVFLASLPWLLRAPVRRLMLGEILAHYHAARPALVDLAANFHKERLTDWIAPLLAQVNARVEPRVSDDELLRYYRSDARTWALLLWLRRRDRAWQRHVRQRVYPFLLPGRIVR